MTPAHGVMWHYGPPAPDPLVGLIREPTPLSRGPWDIGAWECRSACPGSWVLQYVPNFHAKSWSHNIGDYVKVPTVDRSRPGSWARSRPVLRHVDGRWRPQAKHGR